MKWIIKSLVIILLAGFLIFPFLVIIHLHFRVMTHQSRMHSRMDGELKAEIIELSDLDFRLARLDNREFFYSGKRYDILKLEQLDGFVRITAHHDRFEELLLAEIIYLHSGKNHDDEQITRILSHDWICISPPLKSTDYYRQTAMSFPESLQFLHQPGWLNWSPPPDFLI